MTSERSKRRDFLALVFISKSISKKLLIKISIVYLFIYLFTYPPRQPHKQHSRSNFYGLFLLICFSSWMGGKGYN